MLQIRNAWATNNNVNVKAYRDDLSLLIFPFQTMRAAIIFSMLISPALLSESENLSPNSFCRDEGAFVLVESYLPLTRDEGFVKLKPAAITQIVADKALLEGAINELTARNTAWNAADPEQEYPGLSDLASRAHYEVLQITLAAPDANGVVPSPAPNAAESLCRGSPHYGSFPTLHNKEDENALRELLERYNVDQTYIKGFPFRNGYYTASGYWLGGYAAATLRPLEKGTNDQDSVSGLMGDHRGPLIVRKTASGVGIRSLSPGERETAFEFLCEVPTSPCLRSKAERDECMNLGKILETLLRRYLIWVENVKKSIDIDNQDDSLPTFNSSAKLVEVDQVLTGVGLIRATLTKLSSKLFYNNRRTKVSQELAGMINVVEGIYKDHTYDDPELFGILIKADLSTDFDKRSITGAATTALKWIGTKLWHAYRNNIFQASLEQLGSDPTNLYLIQAFLDQEGRQLQDRYYVDSPKLSYTLAELPTPRDCRFHNGKKYCRDLIDRDQDGARDYNCGSLLSGHSTGDCKTIKPRNILQYIPMTGCEDTRHDGVFNDVIVSDRDRSDLIKDCGSGGSKRLEIKEGQNLISSSTSKGCSFKIDNNIFYNSPGASDSSSRTVIPDGKGADVHSGPDTVSTFLGELTKTQILVIIVLVSIIITLATILALFLYTPRGRLIFLRNLCPCLLPNGCRAWRRRSVFARMFRPTLNDGTDVPNSWSSNQENAPRPPRSTRSYPMVRYHHPSTSSRPVTEIVGPLAHLPELRQLRNDFESAAASIYRDEQELIQPLTITTVKCSPPPSPRKGKGASTSSTPNVEKGKQPAPKQAPQPPSVVPKSPIGSRKVHYDTD